MELGAIRIDDWHRTHYPIDVWFTANWLKHRGYRSCWLSLPSLLGRDLQSFGYWAADNINKRVGRVSGAQKIDNVSVTGSVTVRRIGPDGKLHVATERNQEQGAYVESWTTSSVGSIVIDSNLDLVQGDSRAPAPSTASGPPMWTCTARGTTFSPTQDLGLQSNGSFVWNQGSPTSNYIPTSTDRTCGGWVALIEPGAQSGHDLWLLLIGATFSLAAALYVEIFVGRERTKGEPQAAQ